MNDIWKFPITPGAPYTLMPKGARILSADNQRGVIVCWAVVDPLQVHVPRRVIIVGTGHRQYAEDTFKLPFIGTVLLDNGLLAFHLFDGGEINEEE